MPNKPWELTPEEWNNLKREGLVDEQAAAHAAQKKLLEMMIGEEASSTDDIHGCSYGDSVCIEIKATTWNALLREFGL